MHIGESSPLKRVTIAPSKKQGCESSKWFKRDNSGTILSLAPQARPRLEWTLIFSAASHSTPHVKPKPPHVLASAQRRLRRRDQARPLAARRVLSCVSL